VSHCALASATTNSVSIAAHCYHCYIVTSAQIGISDWDIRASEMKFSKFSNRPSRDRCNLSSSITARCTQIRGCVRATRPLSNSVNAVIDKRVRGRSIAEENFAKLNATISRACCFHTKPPSALCPTKRVAQCRSICYVKICSLWSRSPRPPIVEALSVPSVPDRLAHLKFPRERLTISAGEF
jgi:hypothetical protein